MPSSWRNLLATGAALIAALALARLGLWQLERRAWKEELQAAILARAAEPPLAHEETLRLACAAPDAAPIEDTCAFRKVRLRGTFEHAAEKPVFASIPREPSGFGGLGYWILTPFRAEDAAAAIYVNRGFVPLDRKDPASRPDAPPGSVEIVAIVRARQARSLWDADNRPRQNLWTVRDPREFRSGAARARRTPAMPPATEPAPLLSERGSLDYTLDLVSPVPASGSPFPLPGPLALTNRHLEYALTWFALAVTLLGVYGAALWTRVRQRAACRPPP